MVIGRCLVERLEMPRVEITVAGCFAITSLEMIMLWAWVTSVMALGILLLPRVMHRVHPGRHCAKQHQKAVYMRPMTAARRERILATHHILLSALVAQLIHTGSCRALTT
jgi:hypothetical protein